MTKDEKKEYLRNFFKKRGKVKCLICGRKLTNPDSMLREHGPVCWKKINSDKSVQIDMNFNKKS